MIPTDPNRVKLDAATPPLPRKEENPISELAGQKIQEANENISTLTLIGRKFTWIGIVISGFFSWIGAVISRFTGSQEPSKEFTPRSVREGDRIWIGELDQFINNSTADLKPGDRIAVKFDGTHYVVKEIKKNDKIGDEIIVLGMRGYPLNEVKKLKNNPPKTEIRKKTESSLKQIPIKVNETFFEINNYSSDAKSESPPKIGDLVAIEEGYDYRVYKITKVNSDSSYELDNENGDVITARFDEIVPLREYKEIEDPCPRPVNDDERISEEEIDLFASESKAPLKTGDRVALQIDDSYYVTWIKKINNGVYELYNNSSVSADKLIKLKKNPLQWL